MRPVNTLGNGYSISTGVRGLRTFGEADARNGPSAPIIADSNSDTWNETSMGSARMSTTGTIFGIPESRTDDVGVLTNLQLPVNDQLSFTIGGRVRLFEGLAQRG